MNPNLWKVKQNWGWVEKKVLPIKNLHFHNCDMEMAVTDFTTPSEWFPAFLRGSSGDNFS